MGSGEDPSPGDDRAPLPSASPWSTGSAPGGPPSPETVWEPVPTDPPAAPDPVDPDWPAPAGSPSDEGTGWPAPAADEHTTDEHTTDEHTTDEPPTDDAPSDDEGSSPDTGSPDTGSPDTGSPDTGSPDTGSPDTGGVEVVGAATTAPGSAGTFSYAPPETVTPGSGEDRGLSESGASSTVPPGPLHVPDAAPDTRDTSDTKDTPGVLDTTRLLRSRPVAPTGGLRRLVWRLSGGRIAFPPTGDEQARDQLHARIRTPAESGRRRIAMISLKGGVGKTTTTVMLGHTLASLRGDNVIAVDANPDAGNLAHRVERETTRTARDLLDARGTLGRYADVRQFTTQADSRLEVLAAESDPALSQAFSATDYEAVLAALERFYSIVLTDCGTGILHDAMRAVLWYVDQLVVVTSPAIDSAQALGQLLDWLDKHGYHHLVQSSIVVVNGARKRSEIRVDQFAATFGSRCRAVVTIPYDPALSTGGVASLPGLGSPTRQAYLELAAAVGDGFSIPRLNGRDPRPEPPGPPGEPVAGA